MSFSATVCLDYPLVTPIDCQKLKLMYEYQIISLFFTTKKCEHEKLNLKYSLTILPFSKIECHNQTQLLSIFSEKTNYVN